MGTNPFTIDSWRVGSREKRLPVTHPKDGPLQPGLCASGGSPWPQNWEGGATLLWRSPTWPTECQNSPRSDHSEVPSPGWPDLIPSPRTPTHMEAGCWEPQVGGQEVRGPLFLRDTDRGHPSPALCPSPAPCRPSHMCQESRPRGPLHSILVTAPSAAPPPESGSGQTPKGASLCCASPPPLHQPVLRAPYLGWACPKGGSWPWAGVILQGALGHSPPHLLPSASLSVKLEAMRVPDLGTRRPLNWNKTPHNWGRAEAPLCAHQQDSALSPLRRISTSSSRA